MALIEITVDNPSLINTGEGEATSEDGESSLEFSSGRTEDGDADTDLIGTVGTFVTALSALAGVLRQLRSEETGDAEAEGGLSLTDEDTEDEPIIGGADETEETDELDETEDEALETGLEGEDTVEEESSGSGFGAKVTVLLVIVLVVAVLLSRGDDEDPEFEEFDA